MSDIPSELKYTESHEWLRLENDGTATVGITAHAQELLGDLVYVELPELDDNVIQSTEVGVVESVKAASDLYTPVSGRVIEINEELEATPELINRDPYGEGWIFRIELSDTGEVDQLLDADAYGEMTAEEH